MNSNFKTMLDAYKKGDWDDTIGLFRIIQNIEKSFPDLDSQKVEDLTLECVRQMLAEGFQAGNPVYSSTGYVPWDNQDPNYVVNRIRKEWRALNERPNLPHIVWFGLPGYDYSKNSK